MDILKFLAKIDPFCYGLVKSKYVLLDRTELKKPLTVRDGDWLRVRYSYQAHGQKLVKAGGEGDG